MRVFNVHRVRPPRPGPGRWPTGAPGSRKTRSCHAASEYELPTSQNSTTGRLPSAINPPPHPSPPGDSEDGVTMH